MTSDKEAKARIKINQYLEKAGCVFLILTKVQPIFSLN